MDPQAIHIPQSLMGFEVTGSALGIIGMGEVACKTAQRCKGFERSCSQQDQTVKKKKDYKMFVTSVMSLIFYHQHAKKIYFRFCLFVYLQKEPMAVFDSSHC